MGKLYCTAGAMDLTIIADSMDEALDIAEAVCVEDEIQAWPAHATSGRRWVKFDYRHHADDCVLKLAACGVDLGDIHRRAVTDGHGDDRYSEVGAYDVHWCMLPSGVLCGGDE